VLEVKTNLPQLILLRRVEISTPVQKNNSLFRRIAFHLSTFAGGEMSLSARYLSQANKTNSTNHLASHDLPGQDKNRSDSTAKPPAKHGYDSLVEHILDFLDKYPSGSSQRGPLTGCMPAC
jgi:hypothetical protein